MTYSVHNFSDVPLFINELGTRGIFSWSRSHHQRKHYPLKVLAMTSHCFDNTNQVLNITSQLACAGGHRPDGSQGGETLGRPYYVL